jgi:hypothetical protein
MHPDFKQQHGLSFNVWFLEFFNVMAFSLCSPEQKHNEFNHQPYSFSGLAPAAALMYKGTIHRRLILAAQSPARFTVLSHHESRIFFPRRCTRRQSSRCCRTCS